MSDLEKVIKTAEDYEPYAMALTSLTVNSGLFLNMLTMLKKQKEKPLRCKTCTMHDRTRFCHRWNIEVKDDDYCSFGAWKGW